MIVARAAHHLIREVRGRRDCIAFPVNYLRKSSLSPDARDGAGERGAPGCERGVGDSLAGTTSCDNLEPCANPAQGASPRAKPRSTFVSASAGPSLFALAFHRRLSAICDWPVTLTPRLGAFGSPDRTANLLRCSTISSFIGAARRRPLKTGMSDYEESSLGPGHSGRCRPRAFCAHAPYGAGRDHRSHRRHGH
jgi:hypothetical protein